MNMLRHAFRLALLAMLVGDSGCAPGYHQCICPCIRYRYCPPAPLPYMVYGGCPTPAVAQYRNRQDRAEQVSVDSETVDPAGP